MVVYIVCNKCTPAKDIPAARFKEHDFFAHQNINDFRPNDIQFYSEHVRSLAHPQQNKVAKLIINHCIKYEGGGTYICTPIQGYNKTTYRITKAGQDFACSCQFNRTKGLMCSHIGALYEFFALKQVYPEIEVR